MFLARRFGDGRTWTIGAGSEGKAARSRPRCPRRTRGASPHYSRSPGNLQRFSSLWPYLCSEGTAWAAAYAAVPYVVEVASRLPPDRRFEHLDFVGLVVIHSRPEDGESVAVKPYLVDSYRTALQKALPLLTETLACRHGDVTETRELLAVAAALKGYPELGAMLQQFSVTCPRCDNDVMLWG